VAVAPSEAVAPTLPDELPGIDVRGGLATSMGNQGLYQRMLVLFCLRQRQFADEFTQARSSADATAAQRRAHTLRGTAGNIGAKDLALSAGALEEACKRAVPDDELGLELRETLEALDQVIQSLDRWIARLPPSADLPTPVSAAPPERTREAIDTLLVLLKAGDAAAGQVWEDHSTLFRAAFPHDWQAIGEYMQAFDFDEALSALERAHAQGSHGASSSW
jgi:two-component system sensor histidine kinase/response regulator